MPTTPQGLTLYSGRADEDVLVARWWGRMAEDGDLDNLFLAESRTLGALFSLVRPPRHFVYLAEEPGGIWFAMWGDQIMAGAFIGMWLRRDRRRTRRGLCAFLDGLEWLLSIVPVVLGVTKQPNIVAEHERLGYTVFGRLPEFFDGQEATVVALTRDAFAKTLEKYKRLREVARG